jgi:hypothetical protein
MHAIRQREIDNAVFAAKGNRRLGAMLRERPEPAPLPPAKSMATVFFFLYI